MVVGIVKNDLVRYEKGLLCVGVKTMSNSSHLSSQKTS